MLSVSPADFKDPELAIQRDQLHTFRTLRSYMTREAITHCADESIALHVCHRRGELQKWRIAVNLIMDNNGALRNANVLRNKGLGRFGFQRIQHSSYEHWMLLFAAHSRINPPP
jgi:hypothetical protein